MNINVSMKKVIIVVCVFVIAGGCVWWLGATKNSRAARKEYKSLVRLAELQAVKIAVIEQASKLTKYQQQLRTTQKPVKTPATPVPSIADPKSIPE